MRAFIILSATLLFISCSGTAPIDNSAGNNQKPPAGSPADITSTGKKLYTSNCAACHKISGTGGKMEFDGKTIDPEDLTSEKMRNTPDDKMYVYIFDGVPDEGMPAFKDKLKEAEVREIVRYIRMELQKVSP